VGVALALLRVTTPAESPLEKEALTLLPFVAGTIWIFLEAIVFGVLIGFGTGERDER
jgi:ABC-type phosphate transport system permease subunit